MSSRAAFVREVENLLPVQRQVREPVDALIVGHLDEIGFVGLHAPKLTESFSLAVKPDPLPVWCVVGGMGLGFRSAQSLPIRFGSTFLSDRVGTSYTRHKIENLTMAQAFDTLSAARELEASGFNREQAEAIAAIVRAGQGDLATKADIRQVREQLERSREQLAHKIEVANTQLRGEVKQDIAELRGENRLLKWMIGFTLTLTLAGLSTSIAILLKLLITTN